MRRYVGDINTRARGLRTHLLSTSELDRLSRSTSLSELKRELAQLDCVPSDALATPTSLELGVRRRTASFFETLNRWCFDERRATLAVVFEDEDRRSIQTVLRGAEQGTASKARMTGLIPTSSLPERALRTLCAQPTPIDVVRMLVLWNHPFGAALVPAAGGPHPSLFDMEVSLHRAFARRATASAHEGGRQLVDYVEHLIDVMNAWSALLHFVERDPSIVDLTFVDGGRWLSRDLCRELMGLRTRHEVEARLSDALRSSPVARVFRGRGQRLDELDNALLRTQIEWQKREARLDPGSASTLLAFALELRAEARNLRSIIWGVFLRAPAALIQSQLVAA